MARTPSNRTGKSKPTPPAAPADLAEALDSMAAPEPIAAEAVIAAAIEAPAATPAPEAVEAIPEVTAEPVAEAAPVADAPVEATAAEAVSDEPASAPPAAEATAEPAAPVAEAVEEAGPAPALKTAKPAPRRAPKTSSAGTGAPARPTPVPRPPVRAVAPPATALRAPVGVPASASAPMGASLSPFSQLRVADMTKMMTDFKIPGVDFEAFLSTQRKNFEAVTAANQLALEGMQAVVRRQSELVRQSWEESSKVMSDLLNGGAPEEKVSKQVDLMKGAFDKAIANVKEVTELLAKSNGAAADVLSTRVRESIEEVKSAIASAMPKH